MLRFGLFFLVTSMVLPVPCAQAAGAEAREVARLNNCTPKKVEVYQQKVGSEAQTIYKVECVTPKAVDDKGPQAASAVLIQCNGGLCAMLRPLYPSSN
ncbi:MAG: hypothetical protein PHW63_08760 [Alphaproteobacteria bacterium]|nr:hypothetical protein [Alphaproteobacteria bacterium]